MSKLISKKLLENGNNRYVAQIGVSQKEAKALRDLVQSEVNRQRREGKLESYPILKNCLPALNDAYTHLKFAYDKRQEGRYQSKHRLDHPLIHQMIKEVAAIDTSVDYPSEEPSATTKGESSTNGGEK